MSEETKNNVVDNNEPIEPADEAAPKDDTANTSAASTDDVKDQHGNPGINREKYQRDVKALQNKVAELQAKVDEAAKTEESRKALQEEINKLREEAAEKEIDHSLELAGCVNLKAAKAVLGDYDSVDSLKSNCPYLFQQDKKGATGLKPEGAPKEDDDAILDRAFGLKK